jgi:hypothetical protein
MLIIFIFLLVVLLVLVLVDATVVLGVAFEFVLELVQGYRLGVMC